MGDQGLENAAASQGCPVKAPNSFEGSRLFSWIWPALRLVYGPNADPRAIAENTPDGGRQLSVQDVAKVWSE